jgi:phage shock protein PspC (stress-responsive transcriptional regulator)
MNDDTTPNDHDPAPEHMTPEEPTTEQPTTEQPGPRRLYRSRRDRMIAGVCGGIAEYFGIDPVLVRVGAVALTFLGGAGLFLYVAALLLVPREAEGGGPGEPPSRAVAIAGVIVLVIAVGAAIPFHWGWWGGHWLVPLGLVAVVGLLVWRAASGERPEGDARAVLRAMGLGVALIVLCLILALGAAWAAAAGGDGVVAGIVIAAGLALVGGAFLGPRMRWLILPAMAIALPAGAVAASDLSVKGGYGERTYRPAAADAVRDSYRVGAGKLVVDLRHAHLQPGDHRIKLRVGVGEAQLVVPRDVCVSTDSHVGVGATEIFDRDRPGIDVDWHDDQRADARTARVVVDANVGIGAFTIHHDDDRGFDREPGNEQCLP